MKVMVVDNDLTYLGLLSDALRLNGYDVVSAEEGDEALAKLKQEPVDFIISDISMPRMSGMSLHRYIREDQQLKHIPFAWNSAYRELRDVVDVNDPRIDVKLSKTMPLPKVLSVLSQFGNPQVNKLV